jgi:hypothetical protein
MGRRRGGTYSGSTRSTFSDVRFFHYSFRLIGDFIRAPFLLTNLRGFFVPMQERTGRRYRRTMHVTAASDLSSCLPGTY